MKKKLDYNYLFIVLFCLILIFLIVSDNTIFGSKVDWLAQHVAFPDYFRSLFYKTQDFFPSFAFSLGAGQNIYNFSYYGLYNPLFLLAYLLPFVKMSTYVTVLNMILYILFGILCYYFFKGKTDKKIALIVTIIMLSASPILFHFHRHFMFVDYLPFLIIGLIGVDKYIDDGKLSLVAISTFFMITISYYYSVTCIVVLCIYALYRYLEVSRKINVKDMIKRALIFLTPIFIGIMSASILLIPTAYTLISGREGSSKGQLSFLEKITPIFNIEALTYGEYTMGLTGISVIALLYGFLSKKKENKFLSIIISIIFNIPMFVYLLNGNLYFRNKILIPFIPLIGLLLIILLEKVIKKKVDMKKLFLLSFFILYLSIVTAKNGISGCIVLIADILFSLLVIYLYQKNRFGEKVLILLLLFAPILNVLVANYYDDYVDGNLMSEVEDIKVSSELNKVLKNENDIVRTNNMDYTLYNINRIYGNDYNQNSVYSSISNRDYQKFYQKVFREAQPYRNKLIFAQNNDILFQTFMGVKYIYTTKSAPIGYTKVSKNIYKNDNIIPVLYGTSSIISKSDYNNLEYPNNISALLSGVVVKGKETNTKTDVAINEFDLDYEVLSMENVDVLEKDDRLVIKSKNDGLINLKVNNLSQDDILIINIKLDNRQKCNEDKIDQRITINDVSNVLTCSKTYYQNNNKTFHYVLSNNSSKIDNLNIQLNKGIYVISEIETYKLNYNSINKLKDKQSVFKTDSKEIGNKITGTIDMRDDGYFVTSIPYDEGFTVKVDGKIVKAEKVNVSFLGFSLDKGKHKIKITYNAPYQDIGFVVTIIGFIGIVGFIAYDKKKKGVKSSKRS